MSWMDKEVRSCSALVTMNDGTTSIRKVNIEGGLSFTPHEMQKWLEEKPDVKKVVMLDLKKGLDKK